MRDTQLDIYRALIMIYMICVIHPMYWLADGSEPYLSLVLLMEMPLVFFISGASFSLSESRRGVWATCVNRFKRVAVPYYIYACVLLGFAALITIAVRLTGVTAGQPLDLAKYDWKDVAAVLLAQDIPQFPFIWHLWFIPPYLILSCLFPLQVKLMRKTGRWLYAFACLLLFLVVRCLTHASLLNQVLCYNIFMVSGYLFYKRVRPSTTMLVGVTAFSALLVEILVLGMPFTPMQSHKFPPDGLFVSYHIFSLCLVAVVLGRFKLRECRILTLWSQRGYNIYLYQSVAFTLLAIFRQHTPVYISHAVVRTMIDGVMVFLLLTLLSAFTYPLERYVFKKLRLN